MVIELQKGRIPTEPGHYFIKPQGGDVFEVVVRVATGQELWNSEGSTGLHINCTPLPLFYHLNGQWSEKLEFRASLEDFS